MVQKDSDEDAMKVVVWREGMKRERVESIELRRGPGSVGLALPERIGIVLEDGVIANSSRLVVCVCLADQLPCCGVS
jgi:hypothetical protein